MNNAVEVGVIVLQCADGTVIHNNAQCQRKDEQFHLG